jgi:hypothetical protein
MPDACLLEGEPSSNSASTAFRFCAIERVAVIEHVEEEVKGVVPLSSNRFVDS